MNRQALRTARRKFFSHAAALACATVAAAAHGQAVDDAPPAVGLGFSLYGMKSLTLAEALRAVAPLGYDCIELPVMPDWPADSAAFSVDARQAFCDGLARHDLRLSALMENLPALGDDTQHRAHVERLRRAADLARDLAQRARMTAPPVIETILGGKAGEFETVKQRLSERLADYAKIVAAAGVTLAIKAHIGNATQRPEQLVWLLDQVASPSLKAAYDYSHFELQDLAMRETTAALLPHTAFIHVKDTQRVTGQRGFLLPGEGSIDYVALLKLVGESTYRGDVVVEVSSQISNRPGYDAIAAARQCYNHLASAFKQADLARHQRRRTDH